jgi:hypothetical protein
MKQKELSELTDQDLLEEAAQTNSTLIVNALLNGFPIEMSGREFLNSKVQIPPQH